MLARLHVVLIIVIATLACACTRPAPRAPVTVDDQHDDGTVILSLSDVEPYDHVPPRASPPPPRVELAAPLYGALAGAAMGLIVNTGLTLLTEHRWPGDRTTDRTRQGTAILYGAGVGLVGGAFVLANSIFERTRWRDATRSAD